MTIGVDSREQLGHRVCVAESLRRDPAPREELDTIAGAADDEATQVITLKGLNPEAMKSALIAIMGEDAVTSTSSGNRGSNASRSSSRSGSSQDRSPGCPTTCAGGSR